MANFPWLTIIILFPIVGSLLIPIIPDKDGKTVRWYALIIGLIDFAIIVAAFCTGYDTNNPDLQLVESYAWVPQLDLNWSVGADGLSMPLIILTGFVTTLAIMAAWPVSFKPKLFYFLMLAMYGGQIAVFAVQDILLFFLVWELELVPVYLILSIWGGKRRLYAATKFILYTAGGSLFILLAALTMAFYGDTVTFDMRSIALKDYAFNLQLLLYAAFLIAYAVKLPIFPLHTWLPDAHGEATAPAHMLLAGILLKMGGYALLRMNAGMLPDAHAMFAPVLVIFLAAVGVILTPIYLLSMLREILYGPENKKLVEHEVLKDAEPREVFIIGCLLVPIIGIGLYPKIVTQIYDATTVQLTARLRDSVPVLMESEKVALTDGSELVMRSPVIK